MNVTEMSLLSILEREDKALKNMQFWGNILMEERARQQDAKTDYEKEYYGERCDHYIARRDEALRELNQARYDLKSYCNYYGIGRK